MSRTFKVVDGDFSGELEIKEESGMKAHLHPKGSSKNTIQQMPDAVFSIEELDKLILDHQGPDNSEGVLVRGFFDVKGEHKVASTTVRTEGGKVQYPYPFNVSG